MKIFFEVEDIDRAVAGACEEIENEMAVCNKEHKRPLDAAHWMITGLSAARKQMLLAFVRQGLMTEGVFKSLFDKSVELMCESPKEEK